MIECFWWHKVLHVPSLFLSYLLNINVYSTKISFSLLTLIVFGINHTKTLQFCQQSVTTLWTPNTPNSTCLGTGTAGRQDCQVGRGCWGCIVQGMWNLDAITTFPGSAQAKSLLPMVEPNGGPNATTLHWSFWLTSTMESMSCYSAHSLSPYLHSHEQQISQKMQYRLNQHLCTLSL